MSENTTEQTTDAPAPTHVEMRYPGVKNTIQVPVKRVERYEGRGWERVTAGDTDKAYGKWKKADLEEIAAAWRRWGAADDGWLSMTHGELLIRVP